MSKLIKDGKVVDLQGDAARDALLSGAAQLTGRPMALVSPTGLVEVVAPDDIDRAVRDQGWTFATTEQREHAIARREAATTSGLVRGAAEAAVRGASFGLSDPLAVALGADPAGMAARREAVPSGVLELAGGVVPLLLTGGTGAGVAGAGKLAAASRVAQFAPAALAARAGAAAEGAVARAIGSGATSLAGRAAQAIVPAAARGALETGIYAAGSEISSAALGDREVTAEGLMASIGHGTLLGAGVGAGLAGVIGLGAKLASKIGRGAKPGPVADDVTAALVGHDVPSGISGKISEQYAKIASAMSTGERETIERYGLLAGGERAKAGRELWRERDKILEEASESVTRNLDDVLRGDDILEDVVNSELKRDYVRNLIDSDPAVARGRGMSLLRDTAQDVRAIVDDAAGMERKLAKSVAKFSEYADKQLSVLRGKSGKFAAVAPEDMYIAADRLKREAQKRVKSLRETHYTHAIDRDEAMLIAGKFDALQGKILNGLMDEVAWGNAGARQRSNNSLWRQMFRARDEMRASYTQTFPDELGTKRVLADPKRIAAELSSLTDPGKSIQYRALKRYVDLRSRLVGSVAEGAVMTPERIATLKGIQSASDEFATTLRKVEETAVTSNVINKLIASERQGLFGTAGSATLGAALGGAVAGPVGILAGAALGTMVRPGQALAMRAAAEKLSRMAGLRAAAQAVRPRIKTAARALVRTETRREARGDVRAGVVTRAALRQAAARAIVDPQTERRKYERDKAQIDRLAADPEIFQERLTTSLAELYTLSPNTAADVQDATLRGAAFLRSKLPLAYTIDPVYRERARPSQDEIERWNRYRAAVDDPIGVASDLDDLMPEHVEALAAVYPRMYADLRDDVVVRLAELGDRVPWRDRVRLGVLLSIAADPSLAVTPAPPPPPEESGPAPAQQAAPPGGMSAARIRLAQRSGGSLAAGTTAAVAGSRHPGTR